MKRKIWVHRIKWILSAIVFVGLLAVANINGIIEKGLVMVLLAVAGSRLPDLRKYMKPIKWKAEIWSLLICILAGVWFYSMWLPSSMVSGIAARLRLSKESFVAVAACAGSLLALYAVRTTLYAGLNYGESVNMQERMSLFDAGHGISKRDCAFLLMTAAAMITICSKSSPLYPFNDWVDANCFFTVGKSMLHGKVLYRDIFEQKGFYLYIIHALGYLISNTSFFGVYLLEIAAAFVFLVYAYKIAILFSSDAGVLFLIPVLAALVYGTCAFSHGDSAEEFCLPLLVYTLWVGMKALRNSEMPTNREFFMIGVTSGFVLWIKYTMLGFYLGWFIVPAYLMIHTRSWKKLFSSVAAIALGVGVVTLPVILYFKVNDALHDLWQVYFYDNMFFYSDVEEVQNSVIDNIARESFYAMQNNRGVTIIILLGLFWFGVMKDSAIFMQMLCCMLCMAISVFCGGAHLYYALAFATFVPIVLPMMEEVSVHSFVKILYAKKCLVTVGSLILALYLNNNAYMLRYTKAELPQFAFKKYVDQVEKPTLLNYGFLDGGFYTVYDIVPHCKYFCRFNIQLEEMIETQNNYVEQGLSDFVVTTDREIKNELYECVAERKYFFERERLYRLYALKTLGIDSDI